MSVKCKEKFCLTYHKILHVKLLKRLGDKTGDLGIIALLIQSSIFKKYLLSIQKNVTLSEELKLVSIKIYVIYLRSYNQVLVPSFLGCLAVFCLQDILASQTEMIPDSIQFCFLMSRGYIYPSGTIPLWSTREKHIVIAVLSYCCWYRLTAWCSAQQQWNSTAGGGLLLLWKSDHFMLHHNFSVLSVFPSDKIAQIWMLAVGAGQGQTKLLSFHQHTTICVRAKKCGLWKGKFFYFICLSRNESRKNIKLQLWKMSPFSSYNCPSAKHKNREAWVIQLGGHFSVEQAGCQCCVHFHFTNGLSGVEGLLQPFPLCTLLLHGLLHPALGLWTDHNL